MISTQNQIQIQFIIISLKKMLLKSNLRNINAHIIIINHNIKMVRIINQINRLLIIAKTIKLNRMIKYKIAGYYYQAKIQETTEIKEIRII